MLNCSRGILTEACPMDIDAGSMSWGAFGHSRIFMGKFKRTWVRLRLILQNHSPGCAFLQGQEVQV